MNDLPEVRVFSSPYELAEKFAEELVIMINESAKQKIPVSVVLSGGSTPELLYSVLGDHFSGSVSWDYVHLFWGDERCVPPDDHESNYGMTRTRLLNKINIPSANIHRIRGEVDPVEEADRYSQEISVNTRKRNGLPLFDIVILGLGEDGHTASLFPSDKELFNSGKICEVATHPLTFRKRITITGKIINNADSVVFLVTGEKKSKIIENVIKKRPYAINFPASLVVPLYGHLTWFLDEEAARLL